MQVVFLLQFFDLSSLLDSFLSLPLLLPAINLSFISHSVLSGSDLIFVVELSAGRHISFNGLPLSQLLTEVFRSLVNVISFELLFLKIDLSFMFNVCHLFL